MAEEAKETLSEEGDLMGWASPHIVKLLKGETCQFRPHGNSMTPKIESGQLVTVDPVNDDTRITVGCVVLCRVHGRELLHYVGAVLDNGKTFEIRNARGIRNGTTPRRNIFGVLSKVEP